MPKQPFPELLQEVARRFPLGQSLAGEMAVTGQPYADLVVDVPRRELALEAGRRLFEQYALHRIGVAYLDGYPSIERVRAGRGSVFRISMRLLISDNPVISRLAAEALSA